jgi:hypothetical protein
LPRCARSGGNAVQPFPFIAEWFEYLKRFSAWFGFSAGFPLAGYRCQLLGVECHGFSFGWMIFGAQTGCMFSSVMRKLRAALSALILFCAAIQA